VAEHALPAGQPVEVCMVVFTAPAGAQPQALTLDVHFESETVACRNQWPLWIFPQPDHQADTVLLYDPTHKLEREWEGYGRRCLPSDLERWHGLVITTAVDTAVRSFLTTGGGVLLLQADDGPLPAQRLPFWREAIKLPVPHPLWQQFPQRGFVDLQFWGLATDVGFDMGRVGEVLPELGTVTPILRRLDAREFTMTDYLWSATAGAGRLIACALRLQGGAGAQPTGLKRNVAGRYLLAVLLDLLRDTEGASK